MVTISADLARRLQAYAGWHGKTESAVVEALLEAKLSGVYLGDRGATEQVPAPRVGAAEGPAGPRLAEAV